ncbi:hypothetical protein ScPMuIL_012361 [Solemya velum]
MLAQCNPLGWTGATGNHFIHSITIQGFYELRVNLSDFQGNSHYAHYNDFSVGDASSKYLLTVSGYNETQGTVLTYNKWRFSTYDRHHEGSGVNCAVDFKGAWRYSGLGRWYGGMGDVVFPT